MSTSLQFGIKVAAPVGVTWRQSGMLSSISQEWGTPSQLFEMLNLEFGFTLDVCASGENTKCDEYFTVEDDALEQDWKAHAGDGACWLNPPYGRKVEAWIRKAVREWQNGATVVCLVPARTDTAWWHTWCMLGEIRFLRGRLRFNDSRRGRCPFPSAIVVFRGGRT